MFAKGFDRRPLTADGGRRSVVGRQNPGAISATPYEEGQLPSKPPRLLREDRPDAEDQFGLWRCMCFAAVSIVR
jgi:hypothetical protein